MGSMGFAERMRLVWIDAMVSEGVYFNRADLCRAFGISVPQASTDLGVYQSINPAGLRYDLSSKKYGPADGGRPMFSEIAHLAVTEAVYQINAALP